jgi:hypothetical protein
MKLRYSPHFKRSYDFAPEHIREAFDKARLLPKICATHLSAPRSTTPPGIFGRRE